MVNAAAGDSEALFSTTHLETCFSKLSANHLSDRRLVTIDKHFPSGKKKIRPECSDAPDVLDISDATCLPRTTLAMVSCVATHRATALYVRMEQP